VELAGLEPATSWVRSRRALALCLAHLLGFQVLAARSEVRDFGQFPPISAEIGPNKRVFGPIFHLPVLRLAGWCAIPPSGG
jgi:hypothetical protein